MQPWKAETINEEKMLTVRQAVLEDAVLIAPLFNTYRLFYKQLPDLRGAEIFIKERLQKNESVIFLCLEDDMLLGFTQLYPIFSSVSMRKAWLLNDLFVDKSVRGKGIGTALLEAAKKHCKATDGKWLLLQTGKDNLNAQALYSKNGWMLESDLFYQLNV